MERASTVIWLAVAGTILLGQATRPAIADETLPVTLVATLCMKTFIHGDRKEICGDFQLRPEGPSARFSDQASCEVGKDEVVNEWRKQAGQTGMVGPDDRVENPRCVISQVIVPSRN